MPLVWLLVPERPSAIGTTRYGADGPEPDAPAVPGNFLQITFGTLRKAAGTRVFWYLFATFFICGFTTNGLVGTHLIAFCGDMGIPEVQAAEPAGDDGHIRPDRHHVFGLAYGSLRPAQAARRLLRHSRTGADLFAAVRLLAGQPAAFAVFYGLDWIATVPPTLRLSNEAFGDRSGPMVFGWIVAGHQVGAACAAYFGGLMREMQGSYDLAFQIAGMTAIAAAALSLLIQHTPRGELEQPQPA